MKLVSMSIIVPLSEGRNLKTTWKYFRLYVLLKENFK